MSSKLLVQKIDPLIQAITVNTTVIGTSLIANINDILQLVLYISALGFAAIKWREYLRRKKTSKK